MDWVLCIYFTCILVIGIFMLLCWRDIQREDPHAFKYILCLMFLNTGFILQFCISVYLVYVSPHSDLKLEPAHHTAEDLLECARFRLPSLTTQWGQIDACLNSVDIYNVAKGRVPYLRFVPTAFVFPKLDQHSVFVTPQYQSLSKTNQALVLIHECAHIGFGAVDHAYRWQASFQFLTEKQHYENADSFMDAVLHYCV